MPTVEQAVNLLLQNPARRMLDVKDIKLLVDIRRQTWWHRTATITKRQQDLVLSTVSKYLLVLKTHQWPIDDLLEPQWSTKVRESVPRNCWSVELTDGEFKLTFPYNSDIVRLLRDVQNYTTMVDLVDYHSDLVYWTVQNGVQGRQLLQHLLKHCSNWQIKPEVYREIMRTDTDWPVVKYINGEWRCDYASDAFQQAFAQIIQQDLSVPATVVRLCSLQPEFDHTVQHVLKSWLRPNQIEWLLDKQATVTAAQLPSLIEMTQVVDLWPVVLCDSKYNSGYLRNHMLTEYPEIAPLSDGDFKNSSMSELNNFVTVNEITLHKMPAAERAPWIIYFPAYLNMYGFDPSANIPAAVFRNFDKLITVTQ